MRIFHWNDEKNEYLKKVRDLSFEDVQFSIYNGGLFNVEESPSSANHPTQLCYVVKIRDYVYAVPFVIQKDGSIFLKTIFPSRKLNKKYLGKK